MAYTWTTLTAGQTKISAGIMQEIVDNVHDLEDNYLNFGCDSLLMAPSGRTVLLATAENTDPGGWTPGDPQPKYSGWSPDVSPSFTRVYAKQEEVLQVRAALDTLYDEYNSCRVNFTSDYQTYFSGEETGVESGNDAACGIADTVDGNDNYENYDSEDGTDAEEASDDTTDPDTTDGIEASG